MSRIGGRHWIRGAVLLLAVACTGTVISGCEYTDDFADTTAAPTRSSRPAPPPPPTTDPDLAKDEARNLDDLNVLLGPPPGGIVLAGAGGLAGSGFRKTATAVGKGSYLVTAACIGTPKASLVVSQNDRRGGTSQELALDCGTSASIKLDLEDGPVLAQGIRRTVDAGAGSVIGFWMTPAP
jgi:hypothetical protein